MSINAHLSELERKHEALDKKLSAELARAAKDSTMITLIKRQKLLIKDEITRLRSSSRPADSKLH